MDKWIENIVKWYKSLSGFVKAVSFLIAFGGSVYGGVVAYNHFVIKKYTAQQAKEVRDHKLYTIIKYFTDKKLNDVNFQSEIFVRFAQFSDSLQLVHKSIRGLSTINANLKDWLILHASTKEDVSRIWQMFDVEKKNEHGTTSLVIPYERGVRIQ